MSSIETLGKWWNENAEEILKGTNSTNDNRALYIQEMITGEETDTLADDKRKLLVCD